MHFPTLTIAVLLASAAPLAANEPPTDVVLTTASALQTFNGSLNAGASKSFSYTVATSRAVKLTIDARNEDCGAEMRRSSELGFMPEFGRFPTSRTEQAKDRETFTISLFQTRTARMASVACVYSLTVE
jgi:hypothetical protein